VAILAALALLSLTALLIAGAFASLTLSQRSTRGARADELLVASADYALNTVLASPAQYGLSELAYGASSTFSIPVPGPDPIGVAVAATRLGAGTLWLTADASLVRGDSAHRRVNLVARFISVGALPGAPIEARGNVRLAHGITFSSDSETDPDCAAVAATVIVGPGASVANPDSIATRADSTAADSASYYLTASQLAALDSAGVIHVRGDTTISGGSLDGVMLVDGALAITGSWIVRGLVVVRGAVNAATGTLTVSGAIMSFAPRSDTLAIDIGAGAITWSPCTVQRALRRALGVRPVRLRSWAELF